MHDMNTQLNTKQFPQKNVFVAPMWRDGSFQSVVLHCIGVNQSLYPINAGLVMLAVRVLIYTDGYADKCDFPVMSMLSM